MKELQILCLEDGDKISYLKVLKQRNFYPMENVRLIHILSSKNA